MGNCQPAPNAVLELLSCQCSRACKLPSCSCLINGLACTDMCKLQNCTNKLEDSEIEHVNYDDNEEDDEEDGDT